MGKPRLLILIRHAQSEGNRNRDIHQTVPDHRVKLTQDGWQQAYEAGRRLRKLLRPNDKLHFFTSPYRRTRETTEGILATLTSDDPDPSPFKRNNIKVYEEPRLREQDFGNFQPCSAEMERMWQERADYGHFFYRIPNGESAADAYDRISGFNESLWRQFGEDDFANVCVLVTHGLMSRVFLMKWYHFSVEYFEDLRNVNHCEFLIMRQDDDTGKYILENKLRTWSELKREKQLLKDKAAAEGNGNGNGATTKDTTTLTRAMSSTTVLTKSRRWGGCPDGCNHDKTFKIRAALADLVQSDSVTSDGPLPLGSDIAPGTKTPGSNKPTPPPVVNPSFNGTANGHTATTGGQASTTLAGRRPAAAKRFQSHDSGESSGGLTPIAVPTVATTPQIDVDRARDETVSSPDGTPSFISVEDRLRNHLKSPSSPPLSSSALDPLSARNRQHLHLGRDFGGTYSGHSSAVASDADSSEDDRHRRRRLNNNNGNSSLNGIMAADGGSSAAKHSLLAVQQQHHHLTAGTSRDHSRMGRGIRANRLGDHPHSSDGEHEADNEHEHDKCEHDGDGDVSDEGDGVELSRTLTDEADDALLRRAEVEDRSIQGSVY